MPLIRDALSAIGAPGRFALLGAVSGSVAATLVQVLPKTILRLFEWQPFEWLRLSPGSLLPGLVFGLIIGLALYRAGHAGPRGFAAYVAASTVSYIAAFNLAVGILFSDGSIWLIGMIAGLFWSACLTGLAACMFPFARKFWPIVLMLVAGYVLGGLLGTIEIFDFGGFEVFFPLWLAVWQAGYAAAFATALPDTD